MNPREFCHEGAYPIALLLTYDFDALFFERVVLPDLWRGGAGDVLVIADTHRVDESRSRWEGQVRHLGRRYVLERAHVAGAFHPKIILRLGSKGGLVWVGSGNLTSGGWGGNRELACAWKVGPDQTDKGLWLPEFLDLSASWCSAARQLDVLRRARELPWLAITSRAPEPPPILVSRGTASLAKLLKERWAERHFDQVQIVTGSTDTRGAYLRWCHEAFSVSRATVLVDEDRCSFLEGEISRLPLAAEVLRDSTKGVLHAKLSWFDGPDGAAAVVGSANCSAAAWLLPPARGGNTEVITVFDTALAEDFSAVLTSFSGERLEQISLPIELESPNASEPREQTITASEVAWERTTGELHVSFLTRLPPGSIVHLLVAGSWISCEQLGDEGENWVAEAPSVDASGTERFIEIRVRLKSGEVMQRSHWMNDLAELRHAAKGRRIADALKELGAPGSRSERLRVLAELQRIGVALIAEPSEFPDPFSRSQSRVRPDHGGDSSAAAPINPDDLIRPLEEDPCDSSLRTSSNLPGISMLGVLRALFEFEVEDAEDEAALEEMAEDLSEPNGKGSDDDSGAPTGQSSSSEPDDRPTLSEREKENLRKQIRQFLESFRSPEFAASCTATQLQQAAAYPLAVALQGLRGGWFKADEIVDWAREVFDVLFREELPGKQRGLLAAVGSRYTEEDRSADFRRIVGDGTLWVALLHALIALPWTTPRQRFERALAVRWVYQSEDLLASTDAGRMGSLLGAFERRHEQVAFRHEAPRLAAAMDRLERTLEGSLKELLEDQKKQAIQHDIGDLLWHPRAGWGVALSESRATPGSKLDAYLHLRAQEARIVGVGFYVNVSKAAKANPNLSDKLNVVLDYEADV